MFDDCNVYKFDKFRQSHINFILFIIGNTAIDINVNTVGRYVSVRLGFVSPCVKMNKINQPRMFMSYESQSIVS